MESSYDFLNTGLAGLDPDTYRFIEWEKRRQERKIIMIASESICPKAVLEAQASPFSNIYAEGYPSFRMSRQEQARMLNVSRFLSFHRRYGDRRHYKGCDYVNFIESLAQRRAALVFTPGDNHVHLKPEDLFVNVQALSGAAANNAVYQALVKPGDTVMGLALPHGGHLTHGSKYNRSGKLHKIVSYEVDPETGRLQYEAIRQLAHQHKPKMIIAGASAYPWEINWPLLREIADEVDAYLFADIAHPAGLVAAGLFPNPVGYAHAITMTTHKTLCGPRGAIIISTDDDIARKIDNAVFPGEQGGPHVNTIAGIAVTMKLAASEEFRHLMKRVVENARILSEELQKAGLTLSSGGTSTHLCLVNLTPIPSASGLPLKGDTAAHILDLCGITCNKNTIPGDITSADSSAIRLGTTWLSQLGMGDKDVVKLAGIIHSVLTNIKSFAVETAGGRVGRGRIAKEIVEKARTGVAELLQREEHPQYPFYPHYYHIQANDLCRQEPGSEKAHHVVRHGISVVSDCGAPDREKKEATEGCVLLRNAEHGLLEITGERAFAFVTQVVAGDVEKLKAWEGMRTWLLDEKGKILDDIHLFRMPKTDEGFARFWMVTNPEKREIVKTWLRDLSDGFLDFDADCIYNKIDGPVVVEDLFENLEARTILSLVGPKAGEILKKISPELESLPPFSMRSLTVGKAPIYVAKTGFAKNQNVYEIYVRQMDVAEITAKLHSLYGKALTESGAVILDTLRQEAQLLGEENTLLEHFTTYTADSKPYFIGQRYVRPVSVGAGKREHEFKLYAGEPRKTCLAEEHQKLTNRALVPFAGWFMPILYTSILDEHKAVRETAGLFDVSHMGVLEVTGEGASRFLDLVSTNYASKMQPGQSLYAYLIDPQGKVIDDIMMYCRGIENFMVIVNASNAEKDYEWLRAILAREVVIDPDFPHRSLDVTPTLRNLKDPSAGKDSKVDVALQGPKSLEIMQAVLGANKEAAQAISKLKKATFLETTVEGMPIIISRSGYTGENWGFELYLHPQHAPILWNLLLEKGKSLGIAPTGLGARDSTRTESGFPLYGHELAGEFNITPKEAGYESFVKYHKPFFVGKKALLEKDEKSKNEVVRFSLEETGIRAVRPGALVLNRRGQFIGTVTSCTFIGTSQIGMAYIDKRYASVGTRLGIFIVAPGTKVKHKTLTDLQMGDSFPLHESATVISRFPMRCSC